MENIAFMQTVVKHLVDGTLDDTFCRICLGPLGSSPENIFTRICQDDNEFSVANVLELLCHVKLTKTDNSKVCSDCFIASFTAIKMFRNFQRSSKILEYYTDEILKNLDYIDSCEDQHANSICITLEEYIPSIKDFNYDIENFLNREFEYSVEEFENDQIISKNGELIISKDGNITAMEHKLLAKNDNIVLVVEENGESVYYKLTDNNILESYDPKQDEKVLESGKKRRKQREKMPLIKCSRCDVQHRFLKRLKSHMKMEHNVDLFICQICKATTESEFEFNQHLQTHTDVHCCAICNTVFKRRETIIAHLNWHEITNDLSADHINVCEICGAILRSEEEMQDHYDKRHDRKHTCHYCGKRYRLQMSLDKHLEKHEIYSGKKIRKKEKLTNDVTNTLQLESKTQIKPAKSKSISKGSFTCEKCGRSFVNERALKWHTMLHTNERPYKCGVCGRGFISANRRNQHALCSHAPPARRCPLCPALFHLTSMVNSHLKKVHLQAHKRRNRSRRQSRPVTWRAEPVPIQELGLDIQHKVLELQAAQEIKQENEQQNEDIMLFLKSEEQ